MAKTVGLTIAVGAECVLEERRVTVKEVIVPAP